MKKILIIAFLTLSLGLFAQQKHITFGQGMLNNTAWQHAEDNFTELYNAVNSNGVWLGPCSGSKYTSLRKAIKKFGITRQFQTMFFYVSNFVNGSLSGGVYHYTIEITRTSSMTGGGTVVVRYDAIVYGSPKTGVCYFGLMQANNSGYIGDIEIDLDQLALGNTYTGASWIETGLYAVNTYYEAAAGGGGGATKLLTYSDNFTADGLSPIYIYDGPSDKSCTIDTAKNCVGNIWIKNKSAYDLGVWAAPSYQHIDGGYLLLHAGGDVKIIPDSSSFIATGNGYEIQLP